MLTIMKYCNFPFSTARTCNWILTLYESADQPQHKLTMNVSSGPLSVCPLTNPVRFTQTRRLHPQQHRQRREQTASLLWTHTEIWSHRWLEDVENVICLFCCEVQFYMTAGLSQTAALNTTWQIYSVILNQAHYSLKWIFWQQPSGKSDLSNISDLPEIQLSMSD